jgi:hypothetical protein
MPALNCAFAVIIAAKRKSPPIVMRTKKEIVRDIARPLLEAARSCKLSQRIRGSDWETDLRRANSTTAGPKLKVFFLSLAAKKYKGHNW